MFCIELNVACMHTKFCRSFPHNKKGVQLCALRLGFVRLMLIIYRLWMVTWFKWNWFYLFDSKFSLSVSKFYDHLEANVLKYLNLLSHVSKGGAGLPQRYSAGLRVGWLVVRVPARSGNFSLYHRIKIGSVGPTQLPIEWVPETLSLGIKWPARETNHSPPPSAEVKNAWSYTSTPPMRLHSMVLS
jgi:hypothetical protein